MYCYYFFLEALLQSMAKNNSSKKQIVAESQAALKHAIAWKLEEEKI